MNKNLKLLIILAFIVLCAALVGACGRKGDPAMPTSVEAAE